MTPTAATPAPKFAGLMAIVQRDFTAFFSNPTGYVFITVFVFLGALGAFFPDAFFARNLANLDTLTKVFPLLLLFFIPAITMGTWADERRHGTDELLLTMPFTEFELVVGKYLASVCTYAVALAFSFTYVIVLWLVGSPDLGLIFSTYLGYFLLGSALIAVAQVGSLVAGSPTVAFIYGALICAAAVFFESLGGLFDLAGASQAVAVAAGGADAGAGASSASAAVSGAVWALRWLIAVLCFGGGIASVGVAGMFERAKAPLRWAGSLAVAVGAVLILVNLFPPEVGARFFREGSVLYPFREVTSGVMTLQALVTLCSFAAAAIFLSYLILRGRRRGMDSVHAPIRFLAVAAGVLMLATLSARTATRIDFTAERLNALSASTYKMLDELDPSKPVYIRAYISSTVPQEYVETRKELVQKLREYEARAGGAIVLEVRPTEPYSANAREAEEQYGIKRENVFTEKDGARAMEPIYLGVAMTRGAEREEIPFMYRRYSPEYELTRAVRVVSRAKRRRIGVLATDAKVNGGFDMQRMSQSPPWPIVEELQKQYEVVNVSADGAYPGIWEAPTEGATPTAADQEKMVNEKLDVLLAVMPSSLTQPQLDRFMEYVKSGYPVVVVDDPMPTENPALAASAAKPRQGGGGPFGGGGQPPTPKGDFESALRDLGIFFPSSDVVWQGFNPHPKLPIPQGMKEIVFVTKGNGSETPFNPDHPVSSGLREVVALFSGHVTTTSGSTVKMTPLLSTGERGGTLQYGDIWQTSPWGGGGINPGRLFVPTKKEYHLAAIFEGQAGAPNLGFIADTDMIGGSFFQFRKDMGPEVGEDEFDFDNVTLILNMIDHLAGDSDFIALRKRRPVHRRLTTIEARVNKFRSASEEVERNAKTAEKTKLDEAQARLNEAVDRINKREDLDAVAKRIMLAQTQEVESRRFARDKKGISDDTERTVYLARIEKEQQTRNEYFKARLMAMLLPLFPPLILAGIFFSIRWRREQEATIR